MFPHGHAFLTREVVTVLYKAQTHNGILLLFYTLIITSFAGHILLTQRTQGSAKDLVQVRGMTSHGVEYLKTTDFWNLTPCVQVDWCVYTHRALP